MPAAVMDGAAVARRSLDETRERVTAYRAATGRAPRLATVLVGDDPGSNPKYRTRSNECGRVGIDLVRRVLAAHSTTEQVIDVVAELVADDEVDGILVQMPLPVQIDRRAVLRTICPTKDVDGVAALAGRGDVQQERTFVPCAPAGIIGLLDAYEVPVAGRHIVVVVSDAVLGRPTAKLLLDREATVTICHSRTRGLSQAVAEADVLIAAVSRPELIRGEWIKPGAVVIDAGDSPCGTGDVAFGTAAERASLITSLPGGVGPMTIATVLAQTVEAAERRA